MLPRDGSTLSLSSADSNAEVLAKLDQGVTGVTATVQVDQDAPIDAPIVDSAINIHVPVNLAQDQHTLTIALINGSGDTVATSTSQFNSVNMDDLPLEVSVEPNNGEKHIEPNATVSVVFNKPIDPSLLLVEVRETVSGLTILTGRSDNPEYFPTLDNAAPVQVNRTQEIVPGAFGVLPGNTVGVYQPSRIFAYGAELFVTVTYDGAEFYRSSFKVREIPTFIQGVVQNQQGNPIQGLDVHLPKYDITATTGANGSFAFGFGLRPEKTIGGGQVEIVYNPQGKALKYGTISKFIHLEQGHLNRKGSAVVPILNDQIPYRPIATGQSQAILANGELEFDFSNTELLFPSNRDRGEVHVQFLTARALNYGGIPILQPQWVYGVQPSGIQVNGEVDVRINAPQQRGSRDYLPPIDTYVVVIGFDMKRKVLAPIGVGLMSNFVVNATLRDINSLDYIGYAFTGLEQEFLQRVANGEISVQALISELEK